MPSEQTLMRPLRSDSLKPRPSAQAVWQPQETIRTYEVPDLSFAPPPKAQEPVEEATETFWTEKTECCAEEACCEIPAPAEEASDAPLFHMEETPEPDLQQEETSLASSIALLLGEPDLAPETPMADPDGAAGAVASILAEEPNAPAPKPRDDALSAAIAAILAGDEDDVDEDSPALHDAVPDRFIPEPACVPLYDQPAPKRRRRGWLWLFVLAMAAGGVYAAWKCGYLVINLP